MTRWKRYLYKVKKLSRYSLNYQNIFVILAFFFSIFSFELASAESDQNDENEMNTNSGIQALGVIIASATVPITIWQSQLRKQKRDKVWELYKRFHSKEFLETRSIVWDKVRVNWTEILFNRHELKNEIVSTFLTRTIPPYILRNEEQYNEFMKYVSQTQTILDFWTEVYINFSENTMNKKLAIKVFSHIYKWHREFLKKFLLQYGEDLEEDKESVKNPNNMWLETIKNLDFEFEITDHNSEESQHYSKNTAKISRSPA